MLYYYYYLYILNKLIEERVPFYRLNEAKNHKNVRLPQGHLAHSFFFESVTLSLPPQRNALPA